jgi:hypothetical protein
MSDPAKLELKTTSGERKAWIARARQLNEHQGAWLFLRATCDDIDTLLAALGALKIGAGFQLAGSVALIKAERDALKALEQYRGLHQSVWNPPNPPCLHNYRCPTCVMADEALAALAKAPATK